MFNDDTENDAVSVKRQIIYSKRSKHMESILFSKENGIATITLNRPDKFNSVTKEIALGMQQFLKESAEDAEMLISI